MKAKIKFLTMAMFATLSLTIVACDDDDDDNIAVPQNISQALTVKYPSATRVEWEQKGAYYVADCWLNGKEAEAWFDAQGVWKLTETDLLWTDVPEAVQTSFNAGEYAAWYKDDFDMLEYPSSPTLYVIEVEQGRTEIQLFYLSDGTLEKTKDVTSVDDTHWPE